MTLNIILVIIYKSHLYPPPLPTPLKTKVIFSPPTLAMGPFLYLTINMTSPPWFSFMGDETKDNGLVVVGGLNDASII
jgi:hypothetical protein